MVGASATAHSIIRDSGMILVLEEGVSAENVMRAI
jgi:hypothetical protein